MRGLASLPDGYNNYFNAKIWGQMKTIAKNTYQELKLSDDLDRDNYLEITILQFNDKGLSMWLSKKEAKELLKHLIKVLIKWKYT